MVIGVFQCSMFNVQCSMGGVAYAQWNNDSTEMDSYGRYRVGGYGEILGQFKNYGINRFNGTAQGNSDFKRNTISIPRFVLAGDYKFKYRQCL